MSDRADDAEPVAPEVAKAVAPDSHETAGPEGDAAEGIAEDIPVDTVTDAAQRDQAMSPQQGDLEPNRPVSAESPELAAGEADSPELTKDDEATAPAAIDPGAETLDWGPDPEDPAAAPPPPETSPPPGVAAAVQPPSPDVALADEASPLPGAHRGGFQRLPTAPVAVTMETAPAEPGTADSEQPVLQWLMPDSPAPHRGLAAWALAFSIAGLVVSIFVGWGFPIGLVGVVSAILALRRPLESRPIAIWALVLGIISVLFSAGWLLYAASRANLLG